MATTLKTSIDTKPLYREKSAEETILPDKFAAVDANGAVYITSALKTTLDGVGSDVTELYNDAALREPLLPLIAQIQQLQTDVANLHAFIKEVLGTSAKTLSALSNIAYDSKAAQVKLTINGTVYSLTPAK